MITKESHPQIPGLKYRYEVEAVGIVGYARTKKAAEKTHSMLRRKAKETYKHDWKIFPITKATPRRRR